MRRPGFKTVIVLLLALAAGFWLARATLAEHLLIAILHNAGLQDVTADIQQLDPDHATVSRLRFSLASTSGLTRLEAEDLELDYSFGQLSSGRIETLSINTLVVNYTPAQDRQLEPAATATVLPAELIASIRQGLQGYAFAKHVRLRSLTLNGDAFGALNNIPLELNISHQNAMLEANVALPEHATQAGGQLRRQLVIKQLTPATLVAELGDTAASEDPAAGIKINFPPPGLEETGFTGSYRLDPNKLQHWIDPAGRHPAANTSGTLAGKFSIDFNRNSEISFTLDATTAHMAIGDYATDQADLQLVSHYSRTDSGHQIRIDENSYVHLKQLAYADIALMPGNIQLAGTLITSAAGWDYKGTIGLDSLGLNLPAKSIRLKNINTRVNANAEKLSLQGDFSPASLPGKFGFVMTHTLANAGGSLQLDPLTPVSLDAQTHKLSQLLSPWPYPFDLLAGTLQLSARAHWAPQQAFSLSTRVRLAEAGGRIGELLFSGLSLDHELEILPELRSIRAGRIDLSQIDSGVTASNISTLLKLQTVGRKTLPQISIQNLRGDIFDGIFTADDFSYDLNASVNTLKIHARNIDLARIVETQQLDDITVSGRIDGTIPVIINAQGVSIEHGAFINDVRAGTIRYTPAAGTEQLKQNPLTGITLDALKDFRYSELAASVNFTPAGVLTVNLNLKGTSPELDSKRPVHLNINTEQNLLSLLKSLRYARGVSDRIDANVRQQYEKTRQKPPGR